MTCSTAITAAERRTTLDLLQRLSEADAGGPDPGRGLTQFSASAVLLLVASFV
ncbi:MAG TPA: hypothetical protein VME46_17520 [Acidimicrobiales bacterium]|nr:hypothetical protein [Acidimicrobiales bacterium]